MTQKTKRLFLVLSILIATVALDQLTKEIARETLGGAFLTYLGDTVRLQRTENTGAFLSLGATMDPTSRLWIFTIGIGIFLVIGVWMLIKRTDMDRLTTIALTLIVAGGIGNLIDRAVKGSVTDFMNVGIGWLRTGVFNVADMAIMAGIFAMLLKPKGAKGGPHLLV